MKTLWILISIPVISSAQTDCQDLYRMPDDFHVIQTTYNPVCGCDGITYRNEDAAFWWGGINFWTANTICGDFDMDIYPTISSSFSITPPQLRIFMKYAGTATLSIYNDFGRLMFTRRFTTSKTGQIIDDANPYNLYEVAAFPRGIYMVIVSVGGEKLYRKIIRASD
jgi:hypothetical protein